MAAIAAPAQPPLRQPRKRKNDDKEPPTQVLPLPKDPPAAVSAETAKLVFHVSPLSAKGLLTQQTNDALKALMKLNRGAQMVKLRAFVAGTGDMRRVQTIVSDVLTEKKQPLPALTTVQAGALPLEGAQVVLEAVSADKRPVNPNGIVFIGGEPSANAGEAIAQLRAWAGAASVTGPDMLRVTCFLGSLGGVAAARETLAKAFPSAALNIIQPLRSGLESSALCEGVGRRSGPGPSTLPAQGAWVNTAKLVFSGGQLAFGGQEADLRLAFQRLEKALESLGISYKDVIFSNIYTLNPRADEAIRTLRDEFLRGSPGEVLAVEGLPSLDASMAIEVVAAAK